MIENARARSFSPLFRAREIAIIAALMAAGLGLARVEIHRREPAKGSAFLFADEGHNLLIADTIVSGGTLYRDVYSPYGPIPAYLHAGAAAVFGNSPAVYLNLLAAISALNVGVAYLLIRRAASIPVATLVTAAGMLPLILNPGSLVGGFTTSAYHPIERTLLLLIALAWAPLERRSRGRSLLIGALLGLWQGVRFGPAAAVGVAVVLLDAFYVAAAGASRRPLRQWIFSVASIALAFTALEAAWVAWAFLTLPPGMALDVLWPFYMLGQFSAFVTPEIRWLSWPGWRAAVAQYLMPATATVLGLVGLCEWWMERRRAGSREEIASSAAVFIPLIFYAVGAVTIFRDVHHFRQFMWTLVPASAWELQRRGALVRTAAAVASLPAVILMARAPLMPAVDAPLKTVTLPSGSTIEVSPQMEERLRFLQRFTSVDAAGAPVLMAPVGSGWHLAYRVPHATRHTWYFAPVLPRPYEEEAFIQTLDRTVALIICDGKPLTDPVPDVFFPPAVARALASRIEPWMREAGCRVYRIRRSIGESRW